MKKYFLGFMILSLMLFANAQVVQAKGQNGKVGAKQESTVKDKKHPYAKVNKGNANTSNVGSNKRLEGKEKAIQRRLEGKEKAIERRLEGKQNAIERRSENSGMRVHKGHGKHKRKINSSNKNNYANRGEATNSNNLKQEKNKKYIKQKVIKN